MSIVTQVCLPFNCEPLTDPSEISEVMPPCSNSFCALLICCQHSQAHVLRGLNARETAYGHCIAAWSQVTEYGA